MGRAEASQALYGIVSLASFLSLAYGLYEMYRLENESIDRAIESAKLEAEEERALREKAEKKAEKERRKRKRAERDLEDERRRITKDRWLSPESDEEE